MVTKIEIKETGDVGYLKMTQAIYDKITILKQD
jgi:hypothetical protein